MTCRQDAEPWQPQSSPSTPPGEDFEVLNGRDEQILYALSLKPSPARPLEAVHHCGFTKIAFLKPLPSFPVFSGCFAVAFGSGCVQQFLMLMSLESATTFVSGALLTQRASVTGASFGSKLPMPAPFDEVMPMELLARRALEGVILGIVGELIGGLRQGQSMNVNFSFLVHSPFRQHSSTDPSGTPYLWGSALGFRDRNWARASNRFAVSTLSAHSMIGSKIQRKILGRAAKRNL
jgi:hypothetical protein